MANTDIIFAIIIEIKVFELKYYKGCVQLHDIWIWEELNWFSVEEEDTKSGSRVINCSGKFFDPTQIV